VSSARSARSAPDPPSHASSPPADRLRVVLPGHYALIRGGVGTYARGLAGALAEGRPPGGVVLAAAPSSRRHIGRVASLAGGLARLRFEQLSVPRLLRGADVVQLCDSRPLLAARIPQVACVHDVSYLDHPEWFSPAAAAYKRTMLDLLLARRPAAVVVPSAYTHDRLVYHRPSAARGTLRIIAPGIDRPRSAVAAPLEPAYFLTVATIEPRKNHAVLLAAFAEARARGLDLRWRVVGEPGHRSEAIVAALRAQPGVDFLGWVDEPGLESSYAGAAFLAAASHEEGFGYAPLEAMARGVPVVCSTGSGHDETVAGAALRVAASDQAGWTEALLSLERDGAMRAELRRIGRLRAQEFGWRAAAASFWSLYASLSH
jgi:glycosyltransferase involved in cell wall biosynthesis